MVIILIAVSVKNEQFGFPPPDMETQVTVLAHGSLGLSLEKKQEVTGQSWWDLGRILLGEGGWQPCGRSRQAESPPTLQPDKGSV